jgi:hypothetical protein
MLITPDLSEAVEQKESEPMPTGVYKVRVEGVELLTTKAGEKRLNWKLVVFGAEGELARYNNWPVYYSTMLSGKGAGMFTAFVKATAGKTVQPGDAFDTDECLGKEVQANIAQRRNEDGTVSKWPDVKGIKPLMH